MSILNPCILWVKCLTLFKPKECVAKGHSACLTVHWRPWPWARPWPRWRGSGSPWRRRRRFEGGAGAAWSFFFQPVFPGARHSWSALHSHEEQSYSNTALYKYCLLYTVFENNQEEKVGCRQPSHSRVVCLLFWRHWVRFLTKFFFFGSVLIEATMLFNCLNNVIKMITCCWTYI